MCGVDNRKGETVLPHKRLKNLKTNIKVITGGGAARIYWAQLMIVLGKWNCKLPPWLQYKQGDTNLAHISFR
jgi:hypothetical protein